MDILHDIFTVHTPHPFVIFFFFNDTATTEIYTLSLHDALPIYPLRGGTDRTPAVRRVPDRAAPGGADRKSTRLNSSHSQISYAVFCLKKKRTRHGDAALHVPRAGYGASAGWPQRRLCVRRAALR